MSASTSGRCLSATVVPTKAPSANMHTVTGPATSGSMTRTMTPAGPPIDMPWSRDPNGSTGTQTFLQPSHWWVPQPWFTARVHTLWTPVARGTMPEYPWFLPVPGTATPTSGGNAPARSVWR